MNHAGGFPLLFWPPEGQWGFAGEVAIARLSVAVPQADVEPIPRGLRVPDGPEIGVSSETLSMSRTIAVANQKGGVGKTTTAINLSASFAALGKQVLLVDVDPQGNATSGVGVARADLQATVYEVLLGSARPQDALVRTGVPRLDLLPASRDLVGAEVELIAAQGRSRRLRSALEPLRERYDYIVLDCPPSLNLLTVNALTAADSVLIPLQCEYFAMEGLAELIRTLKLVKTRLNPPLEREGILLTMVDRRNRLAQQVEAETRRLFGPLVLDTRIPRNVRLSEASSFGKPAFHYSVRSPGAQAYMALAHELLRRHGAVAPGPGRRRSGRGERLKRDRVSGGRE